MGFLPEKLNYGELKLADTIRLLSICQNKSEKNLLQKALYHHKVSEEFYDRCAKAIGQFYKGSPDLQDRTDDLFQDSWILIFEEINFFETDSRCSEVECQKVFLFWMSQFANNLILNQWKKDKIEKKNFEKYTRFCIEDSKPGSIGKHNFKPTYDKQKFNKLWSKLNPMSREILLACADRDMFDDDGPKHFSPEFRKYICEKYDVKEDAIRQAKGRAIKALNSCKIE